MDIARGSRRARHVAANAAAAEAAATAAAANGEAAASHGRVGAAPARTPEMQHRQQHQQQQRHLQHAPGRRAAAAQQQVTPTNNPAPAHRAHDQLRHSPGALDPSPVVAAGPPPHPFRLHRSTHFSANTRLSMPLDSDESGSEPDLSVLGMARAGPGLEHRMNAMTYDNDDDDDDEVLSQEQFDVEDTSIDDQVEEQEATPLFDPATVGLKEISNLGKFTVSSHKPGSGVEELRSDDLKLYWQSDGPQPHRLTVYFVKRVGIRDIRFFVDYNEDESYTPTKIVFKSGTSENNLIEFATMNLDSPVGWQQVPIAGAGGEPDGNTLVSYVLQMQILENHQNGKDTHLRGIKIYAFDADAAQSAGREGENVNDDTMDLAEMSGELGTGHGELSDRMGDIARTLAAARLESGETGLAIPDFMREPEIR